MEEDNQDTKRLAPLFSRLRSPTYSKEEIKTLVNLVEKFKNIVQNKSINNASCHAKELAWCKIAKLFNSHGFKHKRSADSLKVKWDNLKRDARKVSKNLIEVDQENVDDITSQIVAMVNDVENLNEVVLTEDLNDELKEVEEVKRLKSESENNWNDSGEKESSNASDEGEIKKRIINRSMNFTPQECSILLKCVRSEKKYVFNVANTGKALQLKNRAWARITKYYNKMSPQKRSIKMLRTKFSNMRKLARYNKFIGNDSNKKYMNLEDINNVEKIKSEPRFLFENDTDNEKGDDSGHNDDDGEDNFNTLRSHSSSSRGIQAPDPLLVVLNSGDSGLDSLNDSSPDNKEVIKLKTQLLHYQLETAKLERRRIEVSMLAEAEANQARAAETALRLRAARLEAVAAAMKLPHGHVALHFTPEEAHAQQYLIQFHQT